jgi:hypothetical protein
MCGCGKRTPLAKKTRGSNGLVKGEHVRYLKGHVRERPRPQAAPRPPLFVQRGPKPPEPHWHLLEHAPGPDKVKP